MGWGMEEMRGEKEEKREKWPERGEENEERREYLVFPRLSSEIACHAYKTKGLVFQHSHVNGLHVD